MSTEILGLMKTVEDNVSSMNDQQKSEIAELRREIERVEAKNNLHGVFAGLPNDADDRRVVRATPSEKTAFAKFLRTGDAGHLIAAKAVQVGVPADGGYAVPTWFDDTVHTIMTRQTPLLGLVTKNQVSNFPARHLVSLGSGASGWVGETGARTATNSPTLASVECPGADLYANPQITRWALDDIRFDAAAWLASEIALEMSQQLQSKICGGTGTNQPLGFLAAPQSLTTDQAGRPFGTIQFRKTGVAAALPATTTATIDLLIDVTHDLQQRYRDGAVWLVNTLTLSALRKYKDVDGRPILLDSLVANQPSTLLGYSVYEVTDMPDLAANALPIAFGNFQRGYCVDEHESGLRVVIDELSNKPYVGFYSLRRVDGRVLDSNAIKLIKCAV